MTYVRSKRFTHSRDMEKLVDEDNIIGFQVISSPRDGAFIRPLYDAVIYLKGRTKKGIPERTVIHTHETGELLVDRGSPPEAHTLAMLASYAIGALQSLERRRPYIAKAFEQAVDAAVKARARRKKSTRTRRPRGT